MTVLEVIQKSSEFLGRKGVDSPRLQTELLLAHVLQVPRMRLYLDFERELTPAELEKVRELVRRRGTREPVQHILGSVSFCGLELTVGPQALIPRPETELLAERGWTFLNRRLAQGGFAGRQPLALDFGIGSGCVALALAAKCPEVTVYGIEKVPEALELAKSNAARLALEGRTRFCLGENLAVLPEGTQFDLILSNPPYIPTEEITRLQPEVRDHDPHTALDGGADGLDCYRLLCVQASSRLHPEARLMVEFGDGQAAALRQLFETQKWVVETILEDYTARPRILVARLP